MFLTKMIPRKVPNPLIATTSPAEQAVMMMVWSAMSWPCLVCISGIRDGMMTAGDDADNSTNPNK